MSTSVKFSDVSINFTFFHLEGSAKKKEKKNEITISAIWLNGKYESTLSDFSLKFKTAPKDFAKNTRLS